MHCRFQLDVETCRTFQAGSRDPAFDFSIFSQFQNFIILEIGFAGFAVLESRYEKRAVYSLTLKGHLHFERPSIVKGYWLSAMFWLNIVHSFSAGGNDAVSETISWLTG